MNKFAKTVTLTICIITAFFAFIQSSPAREPVVTVAYSNDRNIVYNNALPYCFNGYNLIPLRQTCNILQIPVRWDNAKKIIVGNTPDTFSFNFNSNLIYNDKNKSILYLPVKPQIRNSVLYVPVKFFRDGLGLGVEWNSKLNKVTISPTSENRQNLIAVANLTEKVELLKNGDRSVCLSYNLVNLTNQTIKDIRWRVDFIKNDNIPQNLNNFFDFNLGSIGITLLPGENKRDSLSFNISKTQCVKDYFVFRVTDVNHIKVLDFEEDPVPPISTF
ncbi:MAG: copper amine oxidase N-terminal domain-containing protein [Eubacteriales bacterium]|jgi:hypothetical protein